MVITQRVRASIAVIGRLAARTGKAPLTTGSFSKATGLSVSYLEILCAQLRRAGLIDSVRGPGGGYVLGRPAGEISILEIAQAVDPVAIDRGDASEPIAADSEEATPVHALFERASEEMRTFLQGIRLSELIAHTELPGNDPEGVIESSLPTVHRHPHYLTPTLD